ncbi:NAD-dependent epimerase/dehydratase family protein [Apibacter adventoris]|uniref:Oxidoreductase n=1 Tax=Apibacter adventoris TaxID=1679466 RepID=A0A2S8A925_9FLAO|nr:NAD(P)H-binding protein [Apibacter adventoris]PQL91020.1 oxidoreductase [Apibacter adventoris]
MKTAIVLGVSGLVGSKLVDILLKSKEYTKVIIFVRRKIELSNSKLIQYSIDFNSIDLYNNYIKGDDFFCCIGTTIKKAKTREKFMKIDYYYPVKFAEIAKENGMKNFLLITSIEANPRSSNYYLRTKGILEKRIQEMKFSGTFIFRPSILLGKRKEIRIGEKVGGIILSFFSIFLLGRLKKYKPIQAAQVAYAMYKTAQENLLNVHIYESDQIQKI